jgi:polysaccharide export outer membrane protein
MTIKIFKTIFVLLVVSIYVSCTTGPSISIEKDTIYEGPVVKADSDYILGPGDTVQVTYFFGTQQIEKEYTLEVGDVMEIEFYYHSEINKIVKIRPDGKITLARKGDIRAAGLTTRQLKENITSLYSDSFKDPSVTITLIEFNQALQGFKEAVKSDRFGQSKLFLIRPDGYANLFHLERDIRAAGFTLPQLKTVIEEAYHQKFAGLAISLALENTNSNLVYVSGQVARPGTFTLIQPTTVAQIVSQAGIIWENAALDSIIVVSRSPEGRPAGRLVNLNKVIGEGNIGHDVLLRRFDIVYVPKNTITKANVWVDQYLNGIVPDWVRMNFQYGLGSKNDILD